MDNLLTRVLAVGCEPGEDVFAIKRAFNRLLKTGKLAELEAKPPRVQNTFQPEFATLVKQGQKKMGLPPDGKVGPATERALRKAKAIDARSQALLAQYRDEHLRPRLVYVHPAGHRSSICQEIHQTAGLAGNYALDFCCPGGTPVLAPVAGQIVKISGRNPAQGADQSVGIFGWNIHLWSSDNIYKHFSTHYGQYTCHVGQFVRPGDRIGVVGHWPGDEGRSHTHWGVSSARGSQDAINLMHAIARAPRWEEQT